MARKVINVPFGSGIHGEVDRKIAPLGFLKSATNLRMRERGRLGTRTGYSSLSMTTTSGRTMVAYDIFEHQGRLIAAGNDNLDGYPTDLFEYINLPNGAWKSIDLGTNSLMLSPFRNLQHISGIPQVFGGVRVDSAAGGGFVGTIYTDGSDTYFMVVNSEDQTIHHKLVTGMSSANAVRCIFNNGIFYIMCVRDSDADSDFDSLVIRSFQPGVDTNQTQTFATVVSGGAGISAYDIYPVTNGTTAVLIVAYDKSTTTDLSILVYKSDGTQLGSTINIATTDTIHLSIEADQTANTINLYTVEGTNTGQIRTFNFSGTLLVGPTATQVGESGAICRMIATGAFQESVAIAINNGQDIVVKSYRISNHSEDTVARIFNAQVTSRPIFAGSAGFPQAIVVTGYTAPQLPDTSTASNCIWWAEPHGCHQTTLDVRKAVPCAQFVNLTKDSTTNKLCWVALRDPISDDGYASITLLDFKSINRIQSSKYGGLLYLTGGTPMIYDNRFIGELFFNEIPGIHSITPSTDAFSFLTPGATYSYVHHWEFITADGSIQRSAVSDPFDVTMGGTDTKNTIVVTTPHSVRIAMGNNLFGADVLSVLSRTEWDPGLGAPKSIFRRCVVTAIPAGTTNYGKLLTITDTVSDINLGDEEPIYTEADRGVGSGVLPHDAPESNSFFTATESRLFSAGLVNSFQYQISKEAFLGEPFSFSEFPTFFGQVNDKIFGIAALDQSKLIFTKKNIFSVFGQGPDDLGAGDLLSSPIELASPGGLIEDGWRSFLKVPDGLFFQLSDNKLMLLPRGSGSPVWIGEPIREILESFPVITGTCLNELDHSATFSLSDSGNTSGRLVHRDFRTGEFFVDIPPLQTNKGINNVIETDDGITYLSGGVIYVQSPTSFADNSTTFIETQVETKVIYPSGVGSQSLIYEGLLSGEFRGIHQIGFEYSLDEGQNYTNLSDGVSASGTVGDQLKWKWTFPDSLQSNSITFRITNAVITTTPTEGFVFNSFQLLVEDVFGLENLDPSHELG